MIDDFYPQPDDLAASAVGAPAARRKRSKTREARVEVRVVHGNLAFANHPVAVGHYAGDTIISAEADLDRRLDGELTRRASLGLYPGALETCAIFAHPRLAAHDRVRPKGAIVVGRDPTQLAAWSSVVPQRDQRIDPCCTRPWHEAGHDAGGDQDRGNRRERRRV